MKRFKQPAWTRKGWLPEDWDVYQVALEMDVCLYPADHVPEASGLPFGDHGLVGYLAGAEVDG